MAKLNLLLSHSVTLSCLKRVILERESQNPTRSDEKIAQVQPFTCQNFPCL